MLTSVAKKIMSVSPVLFMELISVLIGSHRTQVDINL